jgi:hypothetical protein
VALYQFSYDSHFPEDQKLNGQYGSAHPCHFIVLWENSPALHRGAANLPELKFEILFPDRSYSQFNLLVQTT